MKLLVSKEVTGLTTEEVSDFLESIVCTPFGVEIVLFDSNGSAPNVVRKQLIFQNPDISSELLKKKDSISLVNSEEDANLMSMSLNEGVNRDCAAFLHFPKNVSLNKKGDIVKALFSSMSDQNIHATFCDYSQNGVLMVHNMPVIFCQRITNGKNTPINISENNGIKKYIPLELYNVS